MSWKIVVVQIVLFGPLLLLPMLWLLMRVSGGRVQVRWRLLWKHSCWWLPCIQAFLMLILMHVIHIGKVVAQFSHHRSLSGWCAVWPNANYRLNDLFRSAETDEKLSPTEQFRHPVRERLTVLLTESEGDVRERCSQLLAFRDRFAGAGPLCEGVAERLRLANEGWAAGDFRNGLLLYATVCEQLEQELRQQPLRDRAMGRLAELLQLADDQGVVFSESLSESAVSVDPSDSALRELLELGSQCDRVEVELREQSSEMLAAAANLRGDSGAECLLQSELDQLREKSERLRQQRRRVEQFWAQRQG